MDTTNCQIEPAGNARVLRLISIDDTNRLTRSCVLKLLDVVQQLAGDPRPMIISGNSRFFSAGADLSEISELAAPEAYQFAHMGQALMNMLERFPAPVYAAIDGYCMGGGLDLALACHHRISSPHAIFGHRGAALGLMTGWGGTQRLPRLVGKARSMEMFVCAEKVHARQALAVRLVDAIAEHPVDYCVSRVGI